jgi:hypothetical protein
MASTYGVMMTKLRVYRVIIVQILCKAMRGIPLARLPDITALFATGRIRSLLTDQCSNLSRQSFQIMSYEITDKLTHRTSLHRVKFLTDRERTDAVQTCP